MSRFSRVTEPKPLHFQISDSIREAILRGDLKVGDRLPLEEIASEFGVSRMPVREALIRLEKERLVVFHNRRGAQVAGITAEQVREITDLRSTLEIDALRRAAANYKASDFKEARSILALASKKDDTNELADLHWRFHHCLYAPSERPIQLELIDMLHANVGRFFRMEWRQAGLRTNWINDHEAIVAALERGDIDKAVNMVENHMRSAADRVLQFID